LLLALPFFGSPRYRFPNEAPLCLVAAWGVMQVLETLRRRKTGSQNAATTISTART
jgi:hypothetical protein